MSFPEIDVGGSDSAILSRDVVRMSAILRRCAQKSISHLTSSSEKGLRADIRKLLRYLVRKTGSGDAHLFRVAGTGTDSPILGLRYEAAFRDFDRRALRRVPLQLLPRSIQENLFDQQITAIPKDVDCGRLLNLFFASVQSTTYLMCPLFVDGRLKGILGLVDPPQLLVYGGGELPELLTLCGNVLLAHVIRTRQQRSHNRRLNKWRAIADQSCDFSISLDERETILDTTAFGLGDATPPLDGLRLTDVVSRNFHDECRAQIARAIQTGSVRTCEFQVQLDSSPAGSYVARIDPTTNNPRATVTLYLTDNEADRELRERVRELSQQLDRASKLSLLGQMSTEFAHQLNQPLQAIMMYSNTMVRKLEKGTATDEYIIRTLRSIEASIDQGSEIIQSIREFIRFRNLRVEEVIVDDIIEHAVLMVLPTVRGSGGELVTPEAYSGTSIRVDRPQTTHVLINLIINALEACNEAGIDRAHIEVSIERRLDIRRVLIHVKDNGPGLPSDDPRKVFKEYETSKPDGLGMGLAISLDVCVTQGGGLTAANNLDGRGCTFTISMPIADRTNSDTDEIEALPEQELPAD